MIWRHRCEWCCWHRRGWCCWHRHDWCCGPLIDWRGSLCCSRILLTVRRAMRSLSLGGDRGRMQHLVCSHFVKGHLSHVDRFQLLDVLLDSQLEHAFIHLLLHGTTHPGRGGCSSTILLQTVDGGHLPLCEVQRGVDPVYCLTYQCLEIFTPQPIR